MVYGFGLSKLEDSSGQNNQMCVPRTHLIFFTISAHLHKWSKHQCQARSSVVVVTQLQNFEPARMRVPTFLITKSPAIALQRFALHSLVFISLGDNRQRNWTSGFAGIEIEVGVTCSRNRLRRCFGRVRLDSVTGEGVTGLLQAWSNGDESVREELWPLVYDELRRIAGELMKGERSGHTLQPTALVNEAYLKLVDQHKMRYRDRRHFFAMAARMMRRILVDHARAKRSLKRGNGGRVFLDVSLHLAAVPEADALDLDEALSRLEAMEPEKARVVELKFFGGLTNDELAELLSCSERTIRRHWKVAKLWLYRELSGGVERET